MALALDQIGPEPPETEAARGLVERRAVRVDRDESRPDGLRILEGVPSSWVEPAKAAPFLDGGLLRNDDGALVPTERGMLVLNELVLALTG